MGDQMNDTALDPASPSDAIATTELNYRTFVIANPKAGAGAVEEKWPLLERLIRTRLPEVDFAFTQGPGHATLLCREALRNGWEMVVAVGGDGTLNEVLNGFFEKPDPQALFEVDEVGFLRPRRGVDLTPRPIRSDAVIGMLPDGTGGDFRRTIGMMGGHKETLEHMSGRATRTIDVGQMAYLDDDGQLDTRYYVNIASAGFSGAVDKIANNSWKGLGGAPSFILAATRAFARWKNVDMEVILDDTYEHRGKLNNLVVANGEFFGGGMWIAPGAELDDGQFQVVFLGDFTRTESFKILPAVFQGKHLEHPKVHRRRARKVAARVLDPKREALIDLDGETPGKLPALWLNHARVLDLKI